MSDSVARQHAYREARAGQPLVRVDDDHVIAMREKDVERIVKDPVTFRSRGRVDTGNIRPRIPVDIDPPDHARYRRVLDPLLGPKAIAYLADEARSLANELIDRFAASGSCDFATEFAVPWPSQVFLRLMGLPLDDLPELLRLKDVAIHGGTGDGAAENLRRAGEQIYSYFDRYLAAATPS